MAIIINGQGRVGVRVAAPSGGGGGGTDADAQAFITAASITNSTQQSAINTLVVDLKAANVWTKMKALYPFVGGNASSHKFNLKDPRDLDAAYRLVFNGGWTHSSTGVLPNGTNAYADTKLAPSSALSLNSAHLSIYSRDDKSGLNFDIGNANAYILPSFNDVLFYSKLNSTASLEYVGLTDTRGLILISRISNSQYSKYRNNTNLLTGNNIANTLSTQNIYISAMNNSGAGYYSNRELAMASIGDGLTDAEASAFYTAVQAFQTTLGRQVA